MLQINGSVLLSFGSLVLALALLWAPLRIFSVRLSLYVLAAALAVAMFNAYVEPVALIFIVLLGGTFYLSLRKNLPVALRMALGAISVVLSLALAAHSVPGFARVPLLVDLQLSVTSQAYTRMLSFDKPLIGFIILFFGLRLINSAADWRAMLVRVYPVTIATIAAVILCALLLGYLNFDVTAKVSEPQSFLQVFAFWAVSNLFLTCIAEEAFFRGYLQKHLSEGWHAYRYGTHAAILLVALLFGLAHFGGGWRYVFLASLAGVGYGYAYHLTRRIEAAILTHFLLNTVHFIFFSYPALQ